MASILACSRSIHRSTRRRPSIPAPQRLVDSINGAADLLLDGYDSNDLFSIWLGAVGFVLVTWAVPWFAVEVVWKRWTLRRKDARHAGGSKPKQEQAALADDHPDA